MPISYIKSLSKKYNIEISDLENLWDEAKKTIGNKYSDNSEMKYGTIIKIFKNMINKKYDLNENIEIPTINDFLLIKRIIYK